MPALRRVHRTRSRPPSRARWPIAGGRRCSARTLRSTIAERAPQKLVELVDGRVVAAELERHGRRQREGSHEPTKTAPSMALNAPPENSLRAMEITPRGARSGVPTVVRFTAKRTAREWTSPAARRSRRVARRIGQRQSSDSGTPRRGREVWGAGSSRLGSSSPRERGSPCNSAVESMSAQSPKHHQSAPATWYRRSSSARADLRRGFVMTSVRVSGKARETRTERESRSWCIRSKSFRVSKCGPPGEIVGRAASCV